MATLNLTKGDKLNLSKEDGSSLVNICVGANWGAIQKKGFFGGGKSKSVDLDASCVVLDSTGYDIGTVFFQNLNTAGISHSGDDLVGDTDGDDGLDNEVITVNLDQVDSRAEQIFFFLNSYGGIPFDEIPFASIRIYEGTPDRVDNVFATYNIANDAQFSGKYGVILARFYKRNGEWKVETIGDPIVEKRVEPTVALIKRNYL